MFFSKKNVSMVSQHCRYHLPSGSTGSSPRPKLVGILVWKKMFWKMCWKNVATQDASTTPFELILVNSPRFPLVAAHVRRSFSRLGTLVVSQSEQLEQSTVSTQGDPFHRQWMGSASDHSYLFHQVLVLVTVFKPERL